MKRSQSILVSSVLIASLASFSIGWFFAKNIATGSKNERAVQTSVGTSSVGSQQIKIRALNEVWKKLQESYYDAAKLDLQRLEFGAVKGFVAGVQDPYTIFLTPEESKEFENGLEGQLEGIGAELEVKEGKLTVVTPLKNSPAQQAGIKPGDIIYKIDGKLTEDMTLYEAIRKIRGKKGTQVALTIIRAELEQPLELKITRREIIIDSITLKELDFNVIHLAINQFNDHTKKEFEDAIQKILLEKPRGVILDMRGNGGGYLDISVDIVSEFLSGRKTAVIIKKRDQTKNEIVKTNGGARLADIPLVVLVDKGSASASEIVAGALQDYKRAILIGEKTFGKGSVQELSKLEDRSTLRMTIAKWFTPLDRNIDEVGIAPDREVKMTDEDRVAERDPQLDAAVQYLQTAKK